jgi:hypothetical protein
MKNEEHDELWGLLGRTRERKASPFFANKVMHAIRREEAKQPVSWLVWFRERWILPASAAAAAIVIGAITLMQDSPQPVASQVATASDPLAEMVVAVSESEEFQPSLSDLLANEENSVWLSADPSSLF